MAKTIDERVVQMTFENKDFEKNANQTIGTLDKLKSSLKFEDAAKGLDNVQQAANKLSFSNIGNALNSVGNQFSKFETFVTGIFLRLGSRVSDYLVNTIKGFTIEPIIKSWSKFEQSLISEQTIMSAVSDKINKATGELYNMTDVNTIVDQLRWYTDETSYNIDQMTNAIGSFTASGIDLELSKEAILGISNACADAGVSIDKAESAFTGFSRAIGAGVMTLGIWNMQLKTSGLTNSERFRQTLIDTATDMGYLIKVTDKLWQTTSKGGGEPGLDVSVANITEAFNKGKWATADVLIQTLNKYSDSVDTLYKMTSSGKIDLTVDGLANLRKEMEKQGKTVKDLKLDVQYDTASEAIESLTKAYEKLGLEVPQSLKAFSRAQEAVTLSQAISSIKEAVTSKWSKTFELIFGDYEEGKKLWTALANEGWDWFASAGDKRNELLQQWHEGISDFIISDGLEEDTKKSKSIIDKFLKDIEKAYKSSYLNIEGNDKLYRINFLKALQFGETNDIGKFITDNSENFKNIKFFSDEELKTVSELYDEYNKVVDSTDEELDKDKEILRIQKEITKEVLKSKNYEEMFNDSKIYELLTKESASNNYGSYIAGLSDVLSTDDSEKIYDYINKNYNKLKEYDLLSRDIENSYEKIAEASKKQYKSSLERSKVISSLKDDLKEIALSVSNYDDINKLNNDLKVIEDFYAAVENKDVDAAQKLILDNFDLIGNSIGGYPEKLKKIHDELKSLANSGPINKIKYDLEKTRDNTFSEKDKKEVEKYLNVVNQIEDAIKASSDEDLAKVFKNKDATEYVKKIADAGGKIKEVKEIYSEIDRISKNSTYSEVSKNKLLEIQYTKLRDIFYELSKSDEVADITSQFGESLNEYLFGGLSGYKLLGETLTSILGIITKMVNVFREAYDEVIGPISSLNLINATQDFRDYIKNFEIGEEKLSKFKTLLKGLLSVWKTITNIGEQFYDKVISPIHDAISGPFLDAIFELMEAFGEWLGITSEGIGKSELFSKVFEKIGNVAVKLIGYLTDLVKWLTSLFKTTDGEASNGFLRFFHIIEKVFDDISVAAKFVGNILEKIFSKIKEYTGKIINVLKTPVSENGMSPLAIGGILFGAQKIFDFKWNIVDPLKIILDVIKSVKKVITDTVDEFQGMFDSMALKSFAESFKEIAKTMLIASVSLLIIASINKEDLIRALEVIAILGSIFTAIMSLANNFGKTGANSKKGIGGILSIVFENLKINPMTARIVLSTSTMLLSIGFAMIEMAAAIKILSTISWEQMAIALGGMILAMVAMTKVISELSKMSATMKATSLMDEEDMFASDRLKSVRKAFMSLAESMLIISVALKIMSTMTPEQAIISGISFIAILTLMTQCLKELVKVANSNRDTFADDRIKAIRKAFMSISEAMLIVSVALKLLSTIDPNQMLLSLVVFGASLYLISIIIGDFAKITKGKNFSSNMKAIGTTIEMLAVGMLILSAALKIMSTMNLGSALIALGSFVIVIEEVTSSIQKIVTLTSYKGINVGNLITLGLLFNGIAIGITIIAAALKLMSTMDLGQAIIALGSFVIVIEEVTKTLEKLLRLSISSGTSIGKILSVGVTFSIMATSMIIIATALKVLSTMNLGSAIIAVVSFIAVLDVVTVCLQKLIALAAYKGASIAKFISIGLLFVAVAGSMLVIASAIKLLSTIRLDSMATAVVGIFLALKMISLFINSIGDLSFKQVGVILILAAAMVLLMPALIKLTAVMTVISNIPVGNLIKSGVAIAALLGVIVALSAFLGNSMSSVAAIIAMAASLWLMAPALEAITKVVETLGALPIGQLLKGVGAIIAILAAVSLLGLVLGGSGVGALGVIALSGSLLIIAAACWVFAQALDGITNVLPNFASACDRMNKSTKNVLKVLGILALFSVVLGALVLPMLLASTGLLALGIAIDVLSTGMIKLMAALTMFKTMGKEFVDLLESVIDSITKVLILTVPKAIISIVKAILSALYDLADTVFTFLENLINRLFDFIAAWKPKLIEGVAETVTLIAEAIAAKAYRYGEACATIVEAILTSIRDHTDSIMSLVGEVIAKLVLGIGDLIPNLVDSAFKFVIKILDGLAKAIDDNSLEVGASLGRILAAIAGAIVKIPIGATVGLFDYLWALITGDTSSAETSGTKNAEVYISSAENTLQEGGPRLQTIGTNLGVGAANSFYDSYRSTIRKAGPTLEKTTEDALPKPEDLNAKQAETGTEGAESLISSFSETLKNADTITSVTEGGGSVLDTLGLSFESDDAILKMFNCGEGTTGNFLDGMLSDTSITNLLGGGENMIGTITDGVESDASTRALFSSGEFTVDGLLAGIFGENSGTKLSDAGAWIFNTINDSYKAEAEQQSPSKVMAKNGKFAVLGIVKGIKDNITKVKDSGTIMAEALNTAVALAEDDLASNLNPVISPVLDLSQIQNGVSGINDLLATTDPLSYSRNLALNNAGLTAGNAVGSGNQVNIAVDFSIDNSGKDITDEDISRWSDKIADKVNTELGLLV